MSEDFLLAIEKKTLLKELLKNEDWEKQFRSSLKVKDDQVIKYLVQEEVLSDMIQALINEEGTQFCAHFGSHLDRTLQEASEVLGIILSNVPAINVCVFFVCLTVRMRLLLRTWVHCFSICTATP